MENSGSVPIVQRPPITLRSWAIYVLVGLPLSIVLGVVGAAFGQIGAPLAILAATFIAGRIAGLHGKLIWVLAYVLLFALMAVVGFAALVYLGTQIDTILDANQP